MDVEERNYRDNNCKINLIIITIMAATDIIVDTHGEKRRIEQELQNLYDTENEKRASVRKVMSSKLGFTGISLLHKVLYPLYKFDVTRHIVYDVYHTIPLNVVKNQITRLLELDLVDTEYLNKQKRDFSWSKELKDGRLPRPVGKECKGIGHWKAEGLQKFFFSHGKFYI